MMTYNEAARYYGERGREWDRYQFAWIWCAVRLSNTANACTLQNRYMQKHGIRKLYIRMNRVRKICGLKPNELPDD